MAERGQAADILKRSGATEKELLEAIRIFRKGATVDSQTSEQQFDALGKYAVNLNEQARSGKLDPVIGRDEEIRRVLQILSRRTKNNPILVGEAGVGKTAIAEGIAHRIVDGDVPENLDIFSRQTGAASGATLHLDGGKPLSVEPAGCPEGTSIIVRDLFYNTPARLKFMKQDRAEAAAIAGLAAHIALSHPDISFRLIKDGREELHTPGDGKPLSAVYAALGRDFALALVEVHGRDGQIGRAHV